MNYKMIRYVLGWIFLFEAAFLLVPFITSLVYRESIVAIYPFSVAVSLSIGGLLLYRKPKNTALYPKEGFVIVSLSWIVLSLFGTLPFLLSGVTDSFVDALFETVSGFSTTGASIFRDVEVLPHSILMWRSFSHWVGGMGVLVFIIAFLPLSGGRNMHIMRAESPGPSVSKLVPRVKKTATILYLIYVIFTALEFILLLFGGMSIFEALNTAFATAGTGGFAFLNTGFAGFSSYIQIVVTVFMLLFSVNFSAYYLAWRGRWRDVMNTELKWFIGIVLTAVGVITLNIYFGGGASLFSSVGETLKHVFFSVASLISTTGFTTADFNLWPPLACAVLVLIMFIGACAGSTGGGMKVSRIVIFVRGLRKEMSRMLHSRQVKKAELDGKPLDGELERSVYTFVIAYIMVFVTSFLLILIDGKDLVTGFTAVTATLNNIGPGLGQVGPTGNYADFSVFSKLVLCFNMLAGRLEIFPMLLLFSPHTWKR